MSRETPEPIYKKLVELGKGLPMPPKTTANGRIDLEDPQWANSKGQLAYDVWLEGINKGVGGMTFKKELLALMDSGIWEGLPLGTLEYPEGPRYEKANQIRMKWQDRAWKLLLADPEFSHLKQAVDEEDKKAKAHKKQGFKAEEVLKRLGIQ